MRYLSFVILAVVPAVFMGFTHVQGLGNEDIKHEDEMIACTMEYAPVCGVDGVTYGNQCAATNRGKVDIKYTGECALPELRYCESYYDGCNNCTIEDGMVGACTKMYCEQHNSPRCTAFVDEVVYGDTVILSKNEMTSISELFDRIVVARWKHLDEDIQEKYYRTLNDMLDMKAKELKDEMMVSLMTQEQSISYEKKLARYAYLHFLGGK